MLLSSAEFVISGPSDLSRSDEGLARLGRGMARLRLRFGQALVRLEAMNGHHELGFSSFKAYVLERCERGARWARDLRTLARRLFEAVPVDNPSEPGFPRIRAALVEGSMLWSMAELLARHATSENEAELVDAARGRTVRQMRALIRARASFGANAGAPVNATGSEVASKAVMLAGVGPNKRARESEHEVSSSTSSSTAFSTEGGAGGQGERIGIECRAEWEDERREDQCREDDCREGACEWDGERGERGERGENIEYDKNDEDGKYESSDDELEPKTLRVQVGPHELLMLEASRILVETLEGRRPTDDDFLLALLGEGESSLDDLVGGHVRPGTLPEIDPEDLEHWRKLREALRRQREERAEPSIPRVTPLDSAEPWPELPSSCHELDAEIRRLGAELASRELRMGRLARELFAVGGWARLGYASRRQYAEERVGVSLSSLRQWILLARRCDDLPEIGLALDARLFGCEAALLVGRIATPDTVDVWIRRAQVRTLVDLRDEIDAVEVRARMDPGAPLEPPDDQDLAEVAELRRSVQSGELFRQLLGAKPPGCQMSVTAGSGREVWLRVREDMAEHFRELHRRFRAVAPRNASFMGFLIMSLWHSWLPTLDEMRDKWKHIYLRDGFRCQSPVCDRRDVTPHHLRFRSHGGGDEDENMISLCSWCHLHGIHEGRIRATPPASHIRWVFGRQPVLMVDGRERRTICD